MEEVWKNVSGYEKTYEVSNMGRVRNKNGKELRLSLTAFGYTKINLSEKGKYKTFRVHRLVAQAFIENPLNKPCINHIDCDRANNNLENLEWATHLENTRYALRLGRKQYKGKLKRNDVEFIRFLKGKIMQKDICEMYNLTSGHVSSILSGRKFKNLTY